MLVTMPHQLYSDSVAGCSAAPLKVAGSQSMAVVFCHHFWMMFHIVKNTAKTDGALLPTHGYAVGYAH